MPSRKWGGSPPHKESPPKATWSDPDVSPPTTVSMENGQGPAPGSPEKQPGSPSPPSVPETGQGALKGEAGPPASASSASLPGGSKEEEEKAKRLLYCALCKVAVNSLSQLEAHNKGMDSPAPTQSLVRSPSCSLHPHSPSFEYPVPPKISQPPSLPNALPPFLSPFLPQPSSPPYSLPL